MSCAELVADAFEVVVVDVPVVHHDGAVQVAVDEVLERGQVPVAEEVTGQQVRAGDLQVLLLRLRARPSADRGLVAADDTGEDDQRPDRLVRRGDCLRGAVQQLVRPPVAGAGAGHRLEDVRAPFDGDVVHHHEEHAPRLEVQPVGHRARRPGSFRRGIRDMDPAAAASHLVPVVLGGHGPGLGQVGDLVGEPHPQVSRGSQVTAARAPALREHVLRLIRPVVPRQVRTRRARLLARLAAATRAGVALWRLLPREVISARRHRRVPRVPGDQPFQPRDLLRLFRQLRLQLRVLGPQSPIGLLQRGNHIRRIRRIGHTGTTSQPAISKQLDTVSRQDTHSTHLC